MEAGEVGEGRGRERMKQKSLTKEEGDAERHGGGRGAGARLKHRGQGSAPLTFEPHLHPSKQGSTPDRMPREWRWAMLRQATSSQVVLSRASSHVPQCPLPDQRKLDQMIP